MEKLELINDRVLEQIKFIDKDEVLANPLLISKNATSKVLYLGQETNTWYGKNKDMDSARTLEKYYDDYFLGNKMSNVLFWRYIREVLGKHNVSEDVTWANLFVASNHDRKGTPVIHDKISDISLEYLLNIIDIFEMEKIIAIVGPRNPYYNLLNKLSLELGYGQLKWPSKANPVVYSDNEKILYTYHPIALNRLGNLIPSENEAKKFISKKI